MQPSDRRQFLAAMAGLAAATALPWGRAAAQAAPHRIDVHHHITPPDYVTELAPQQLLQPQWAGWSIQKDIEQMDQGGCAVSITSITTPGLWFGLHTHARRLARMCNEFAAKLASDHPKRFGMFVNVPLPDIDGTLKEIEYGMDTLKADGVSLFTSYGDKWLGDPAFEPVYQELNRRKAIVYTHPTSNQCCVNLVSGVPDAFVEYGADTSRAIMRMVSTGVALKYPDMKVIWSHGGGAMPFLLHRYQLQARNPELRQYFPNGFEAEARKFFYDTAQVPNAAAMSALKHIVPVSQILFGTDVPFGTVKQIAGGLAAANVFTPEELRAIERENALSLMPKYRG
jgi:predicted TIM-barrel fold metal-dependent hydrolase